MRKYAGFWVVLVLLALAAGPANATLLSNGDFETGTFEGPDGETAWIHEGDVRIAHTDDFLGRFAEAQGMEGYYALLGLSQTTGTSTLSQSFSVSGVSHLEISFNYAFDYFDNTSLAEDVFLSFINLDDGDTIYDITLLDLQTHGTFCQWDADTVFGTYTDIIDISPLATGSDSIMFSLIEQDDWWCLTGTASVAGIDNVSVTPTPEPATILMFGLGVLGFGVVSRKNFFR